MSFPVRAAGERHGLAPVDWERLARAETHPVRTAMIELLRLDGGQTLSAQQIAPVVGRTPNTVNLHINRLLGSRVLAVAGHGQRRGARERLVSLASTRADPAARSSAGASPSRLVDAPMPTRNTRTYGEFLVEACALWSFMQERPTKMTRQEFVAHVAGEVQEEGTELAEAAVAALFEDGLFTLDGPYVRCLVDVTELTEPA